MSALRSCASRQAGCQARRAALTRRSCVRVSAGLKLYSAKGSRGAIIEWYLKELGGVADVEVVDLDLREKREHKSEWFLKVNPFGKVPALEDGDLTLFESGAILLYLADKYGKLPTAQDRAVANQWSHFANATLAPTVFVEAWRERSMSTLFSDLERLLAGRQFVCGEEFGVADVALGAYLLYIPAMLPQVDLSPYPHVLAYMQRLKERPACAATVAAPRPAPPPKKPEEAHAESAKA